MSAESQSSRIKVRDLLLIAFAFLSSFAASGSLPLIARAVDNFNSAWGFAPYFIAILLGQLIIVFSRTVRESRLTIPVVIFGFTLSIFLLAAMLRRSNDPGFLVGIVSVRFLEGIMVGIGLPRIFEMIVKAKFGRSADSRMIALNLSNVAGFVLGVPCSEAWTLTSISFLQGAGILLGVVSLVYVLVPDQSAALSRTVSDSAKLEEQPDQTSSPDLSSWFSSFYLLFVAKLFYGYLISHLVYQSALMVVPLFWMTLILSAVFALGQFASAASARRFSIHSLEIYLPTVFSIVLVSLSAIWTFVPLVIALFFHSMLYFFGLRKSATGVDSSKEFARVNSLSDAGIVFGSLFSIVSPAYALGAVALLAMVPFVKSFLSPISEVRAERMHPLVGPITLWKMFRKQKSPVLRASAEFDTSWQFDRPRQGSKLRFLFAGDTVFSDDQATFSKEDEAWIRQHDVRALNLEAPLAPPPTGALAGELLFSSTAALDKFNFSGANALFDTFSVVNNHCLDQGIRKYTESRDELKKRGLTVVDELPQITLVQTGTGAVRIGWLAKSFGLNLPWLQSRLPGAFLNPDTMLGAEELRTEFSEQVSRLKSECDLVLFSYHWGYEAEFQPDHMQVQAWKFFRESGVDLLFGHHPHVPHPAIASKDFSALCLPSTGNMNLKLNLDCEIYDLCALYSVEYDIESRTFSKLETRFFRKQSRNGQISFVKVDTRVNLPSEITGEKKV